MAKARKYNTKSAKLNTTQVRELYADLMDGMTQGAAARKWGLGVVQVGRIARGESRAQETGALEDRVPNFLSQGPTKSEAEASFERYQALVAADKGIPPNPMFQPPEEDKFGRPDLAAKLMGDVAKVKRDEDELDNFVKGDSSDGL